MHHKRSRPTVDKLKLQVHFWLWAGRPWHVGFHRIVEFIEQRPDGTIITTDGAQGAIAWGPGRRNEP
jgi:hypothetical protein